MTIENFLSIMLVLHIVGGTIALISGLFAMLTLKGSTKHRLAGKIYFGGMTAVFIGAVVVAIGHRNDFLLMIGFFSYYLTVRGYRILKLKKLNQGQKPKALDWFIIVTSALFIAGLFGYGIWLLTIGNGMGVPAMLFGAIGFSLLRLDVRNFIYPPKEKMHWWYTHIASMGGSYISAVTAFIVVNVQLPQFNWVLWVFPSLLGGVLIGRSIKKYKIKFAQG